MMTLSMWAALIVTTISGALMMVWGVAVVREHGKVRESAVPEQPLVRLGGTEYVGPLVQPPAGLVEVTTPATTTSRSSSAYTALLLGSIESIRNRSGSPSASGQVLHVNPLLVPGRAHQPLTYQDLLDERRPAAMIYPEHGVPFFVYRDDDAPVAEYPESATLFDVPDRK